ncbi:nucleobindin-2-like isoform X1 [Pomacea canaliculata]|uniref:nucleobindin-2-like isoform X1 n=1 Tax=Pomacea canaliculata TaxID=400727 RepID=UPI000D72B8C2|nr:nucleobindin-2-like isoform X1 [Pomacea canaliculata]XP_025115297.1 nucleobindin-2-like isoform X1 [Pomacea canaliculata]XP_025115298.1 nucleobindin-2-like isoform X1 [Pomacea canaliculata]
MRWKILHSALVFYILVHFALCKPVDRRGPPHPDPVEEGSKVEEDLDYEFEEDYNEDDDIDDKVVDEKIHVVKRSNEKLEEASSKDLPKSDRKLDLIKQRKELVNAAVRERKVRVPKGTGLEYDRYLRQVVEILESDDSFRKKLEQANISDIKSGAIASHLELVNNTIRTKLDEIKRMEVQRLHELARIKMRSMTGTQVLHYIAAHGGVDRMDIPNHLDISNPYSFEMKDLERLIKKTTHDLEMLDKKRQHDFKEYEMEKEFEYQQKLKELPEETRKEEETKHEELKTKHKQHEKINHPGSKDQFEEVWEKDDHLEQEFDPKTFFFMHDINGDGIWDVQEVEAVLQRELDKVYDARNSPEEDDPMERFEEMNRMREHVFGEIDKDKDYMITLKEFLQYTGKHGENEKFKEDEGWEGIEDKPQFTDEEFQEYIRQHHAQPGVVNVPPQHDLQFQPEDKLRQQQQQQGLPHGDPQASWLGGSSAAWHGSATPAWVGDSSAAWHGNATTTWHGDSSPAWHRSAAAAWFASTAKFSTAD